ncbi:hypothetical protein EV356DRAFT_504240 [Viridothelium virens]|uniref:RNA polymerase III RPC4-domain-containing protein n=1 Tax=Viridothelium virens TaxID=1048519 RepID=A0A6A6HL87_VIRVR|nr:hypothetical protein EV356DRAFT_504240 [Viridothelium virens]
MSDSQAVPGASNIVENDQAADPQATSEIQSEPEQSTAPAVELAEERPPQPAAEADPEIQQRGILPKTDSSTTPNQSSLSVEVPNASAAIPSSSPPTQPSSSNRPSSQPQPQRGTKKPGPGPRLPARRSKEEREALIREEEERRRKAQGTSSSSSAPRGPGGRGRGLGWRDGRGGSGRGGARGGIVGGEAVASGPFSAGTVSAEQKKRKRGGGIAGANQRSQGERVSREQEAEDGEEIVVAGASGGGARRGAGAGAASKSKSAATTGVRSKGKGKQVKREGESDKDADGDIAMLGLPKVKKEGVEGDHASDAGEGDESPRRDIDDIEHIDLTNDDDDVTGARDQRAKSVRPFLAGLAPVRLPRRDHLAYDPAIKRESSPTEALSGGLDEGAIGSMREESTQEEHTRRRTNVKPKDVEFIRGERRWQGVYQDDEDAEVNIKQELTEDAMDLDAAPEQSDVHQTPKELPSSPEKKKKDDKDTTKPKTSGFKSEFQTAQEKDELERQRQDTQTLMQELGQAPLLGESAPSEIREGRVYLFQLPPVIPDLIRADLAVKQEQQQAPADQNKPEGSASVISRPDKKPIKVEETDTANTHHRNPKAPKLTSGIAGKLRVHESGRTTLNWGGTSMELNMGSRLTYLQEVLVAKGLDDGDEGGSEGTKKEAFGLGVIRGKFVVTPDWEEIIT